MPGYWNWIQEDPDELDAERAESRREYIAGDEDDDRDDPEGNCAWE